MPIKFIRATELKEDLKIDFNNVNYVEEKYYTRRASIKKNDILLAVKGATIASNKCVAIVQQNIDKSIVNGSIFRIQVNNKAIPMYVAYLLNSELLKQQMRFNLVANNAVDYLDKSLIYNLLMPHPSIDEQKEIIKIFNSAYTQKQAKEAEAKALLVSIDSYLLKELGISLPEKNNTLQNRIFTTQFSELTGGRFDPKLYDNTTIALKQAIKNVNKKHFNALPLRTFITQSIAGDWGADENDDLGENYEKCLVIRATEFDNDYNLKLDNSRVKYRLIKKEKLAKIDIQENDLLIEKSGGSIDQPVGRISILTNEILTENQICYSNFIHKIRVDNSKLDPHYLFCYLKTIHNIKLTESMQSQTNGIRNLIMNTYFNQRIVVPINSKGEFDLTKQIEIAAHIKGIRHKAKQLQHQAQTLLETAKQEVEKMILGE